MTSIIEGMMKNGETPNAARRFSRSSADYSINGEKTDREIFVSRDNPDVLLIVSKGEPHYAEFIVDFGSSHRACNRCNAGASS